MSFPSERSARPQDALHRQLHLATPLQLAQNMLELQVQRRPRRKTQGEETHLLWQLDCGERAVWETEIEWARLYGRKTLQRRALRLLKKLDFF